MDWSLKTCLLCIAWTGDSAPTGYKIGRSAFTKFDHKMEEVVVLFPWRNSAEWYVAIIRVSSFCWVVLVESLWRFAGLYDVLLLRYFIRPQSTFWAKTITCKSVGPWQICKYWAMITHPQRVKWSKTTILMQCSLSTIWQCSQLSSKRNNQVIQCKHHYWYPSSNITPPSNASSRFLVGNLHRVGCCNTAGCASDAQDCAGGLAEPLSRDLALFPGIFLRSTPGPATKQPGQNGGSLTESQNTMCFFFLGQICFGPKFAESHLGWFCWICFSNFGSTLPPQAAKTHWSHSRFGSSASRRNRIPFQAIFAPKYIDMAPHLTHV